MELVDRIELRRFVGREFLLWLWFESEVFEATLATKKHGSFGMWLEGRLVLNEGRESTVIKGSSPGNHREAKESLLRGKSPERVGLHLSFGDHDCSFTLRGETLAFAGLVPPGKKEDEEPPPDILAPPRRPTKKKDDDATHLEHEVFYARMEFAREVEDIVTTLYRDFLTLRLGPTWPRHVLPAIESWAKGEEVDADDYRRGRGTPR